MTSLYEYSKVGMHIEYLRGISSVSIIPATSLVAFPNVMDNQPECRYAVYKIIESIKALLLKADALKLSQTREASLPLLPLLEEMVRAVDEASDPDLVTLHDHFAEKLVGIAKVVGVALKEDLSSCTNGFN